MLAAQRDRLERLPLTERRWPLAVWRARYLDHPLVGLLARRLIWRFAFDGRLRGRRVAGGRAGRLRDQPLTLPDDTVVTTWHPVHRLRPLRRWPGASGWSATRSRSPSSRRTARSTC